MDNIDIVFEYEWIPVYSDENTQLTFKHEGELTKHFNTNYACPAVYRWVAYDQYNCINSIYIGTSGRLTSRIKEFLHPNPKRKTSYRINKEFQELVKNRSTVKLEMLQIKELKLNDFHITNEQLGLQSARLFIEYIFITEARSQGKRLLNKI